MSVAALALKAGICDDTIRVIENGTKSTTVDVLARLATALDTTMAELLGY